MSPTQKKQQTWNDLFVKPFVDLFKDPLGELGLPQWFPKVLTYILITGTVLTQLYITGGSQNYIAIGEKVGISGAALNTIPWIPIVGFSAACVLCALRSANETLLGLAGGVFAYGLLRGHEMEGMPSSSYWMWGVVLALGLTMLRPAIRLGGKLKYLLMATFIVAALVFFAYEITSVVGQKWLFVGLLGAVVIGSAYKLTRLSHPKQLEPAPEPDPLL